MAKRSQRRPVRYERDQSGCMWGLISMFDFRQGRSTQKLISDRRRGGRRAVGPGNQKNKLDMLTNLDENCQGTLDCEGRTEADAGKPSVKKLIEEEMFSEQDTKKEMNNAELELKQSNSEHGGHKGRSHKRTPKSHTKSCEIHIDSLEVAENLESEWPCLQNSEKQFTNSLDMHEIMEQLCCEIHQKSITSAKHDQHGEVHDQPNQKDLDIGQKLHEAIKLFISQKLINGKHVTEDGEIHPPKELRDALQILSSDKDLFLKLLQGPESVLVKCVENLWNAQVEKDKDSNTVVQSKLSEQVLDHLRQSDEVIHPKQRKFFRRKAKSLGKNPSEGNEASHSSNRIVILKPGPAALQNPETQNSVGSSPETPFFVRNKGPNERVGSHFFLAEIKRKLKNAIGKERQEISINGTSKGPLNEHQAVGNNVKGFKENTGRNSPSKDHFFIEKIARPSMGVKKGEKSSKLKECETSMEHETANYPKQSVSNIYLEAKRHLSEMLSNGAGDVGFSSSQIPKTLGRILSLPEYNFSPIGSPGRDWGQSLVMAQMKFSANDKFQKQETNVSNPGRTMLNLETQSCVSDESVDNKAHSSSSPKSSASNQLTHNTEEEKTSCYTGIQLISKEMTEATQIVILEESNTVDNFSGPSTSSITRDDQSGDMPEVRDEKRYHECLKHDSYEENQSPSSPLTSPSTSSISKKVEDLEGTIEILERPSPVSVLDPLFTEEDVSPATTRSQPVELPMQPLRIQFEEYSPSTADQGNQLKTCVEDKESIFEYVKAVLQASDMNWDDFYMQSYSSSDQLLDPSIFDEAEFFPNRLCCDKKLLFDCINEVLMEVYGHYFGCSPGLSVVKPTAWSVPNTKHAMCEVWKGVNWHLLPLPLPHTLDQIVRKDMAKSGTWMDLRYDTETIIVEIGEAIFEDLTEETILSCVNESSESGSPSIPVELKENECSFNL